MLVYSSSSKWGTTKAAMSLSLIGDISISETITVSNFGFMAKEIYEVSFDTGIVGNLLQIRVRIDKIDAGKPYVCKRIVIQLSYKIWEFPCSQEMFALEDDQVYKFSVTGRTPYAVRFNIPAGGATDSPIWIRLHGDHATSGRILFRDNGIPEG